MGTPVISNSESCWKGLIKHHSKGTVHLREVTRQRKRTLEFLRFLQLEVFLMSKGPVLGWHILIPSQVY